MLSRHVQAWLGVAALAGVLFAQSAAAAPTFFLDGSGDLQRATGVDVGGTLYDVEFVVGTCIAVFDGCDDAGDFEFSSEADALAASAALLDQVLVDGALGDFDTQPERTRGCSDQWLCSVHTPWTFENPFVRYALANNRVFPPLPDETGTADTLQIFSTAIRPETTFARWTRTVPEPGTGLLVGLGFMGLAGHDRRSRVR